MKPIKDMATMAALHFTACLSNGTVRGPLLLQARAFLLQEDIGYYRQSPEV